jgi:hypothetical protein
MRNIAECNLENWPYQANDCPFLTGWLQRIEARGAKQASGYV